MATARGEVIAQTADTYVYSAAARIYAVRLAHFLATQPEVGLPRPEVMGGGELPADVARGLGFTAPAWDPDIEAHKAVGEAYNLLETLRGLWPVLDNGRRPQM